ncbi:hypothetical protein ID866_11131 [Astraeus odoratus]|nr:hypothetical protein ID866_11131 [Astraeus odoratus]
MLTYPPQIPHPKFSPSLSIYLLVLAIPCNDKCRR